MVAATFMLGLRVKRPVLTVCDTVVQPFRPIIDGPIGFETSRSRLVLWTRELSLNDPFRLCRTILYCEGIQIIPVPALMLAPPPIYVASDTLPVNPCRLYRRICCAHNGLAKIVKTVIKVVSRDLVVVMDAVPWQGLGLRFPVVHASRVEFELVICLSYHRLEGSSDHVAHLGVELYTY